jgi:hypothetical protein
MPENLSVPCDSILSRAGCAALAALLLVLAPPARAQDEDYPHGDYQGDCTECHGGESFLPIQVTPEFRARTHPMPLLAAHDLPSCRACHETLDFTKSRRECVACHQDPHRSELGTDCARCHVPRTFIDRRRMQELHQGTRFPLRGSHRALDCEDCHGAQPQGALRWVNTPTECVACHRAAYDGAQSPNHVAAGFPVECDLCHVPTVWEAARFDHVLATQPCVTCHLPDYQGATDPNHAAAGFPTTCETCHQPGGSWSNGTFDHDGPNFPIYTGGHAGRWDSCSTCHTNPSNYTVFTCFGCHPHSDRAETEETHEDVRGFSYNSNACYACHPRGED